MNYPGAFYIHLPGIYWILTRCQVPFKRTEPTNRYLRKLLIIMDSTMVGDRLVDQNRISENTMGAWRCAGDWVNHLRYGSMATPPVKNGKGGHKLSSYRQ